MTFSVDTQEGGGLQQRPSENMFGKNAPENYRVKQLTSISIEDVIYLFFLEHVSQREMEVDPSEEDGCMHASSSRGSNIVYIGNLKYSTGNNWLEDYVRKRTKGFQKLLVLQPAAKRTKCAYVSFNSQSAAVRATAILKDAPLGPQDTPIVVETRKSKQALKNPSKNGESEERYNGKNAKQKHGASCSIDASQKSKENPKAVKNTPKGATHIDIDRARNATLVRGVNKHEVPQKAPSSVASKTSHRVASKAPERANKQYSGNVHSEVTTKKAVKSVDGNKPKQKDNEHYCRSSRPTNYSARKPQPRVQAANVAKHLQHPINSEEEIRNHAKIH